jgi:hypothetical protein
MKAKTRIATLGDKFLTNVCACLGPNWHISTIYEFEFPDVEALGKTVRYVGDVYFEILHNENMWDTASYKMLVELDGKMGHTSKYSVDKDKIRDYTLFQKFKCQTVRFQTYDVAGHAWKKTKKNRRNVQPLSDLEIFEELKMLRCMNLPIPDSSHWRDLIHKCVHDSCIDPM